LYINDKETVYQEERRSFSAGRGRSRLDHLSGDGWRLGEFVEERMLMARTTSGRFLFWTAIARSIRIGGNA